MYRAFAPVLSCIQRGTLQIVHFFVPAAAAIRAYQKEFLMRERLNFAAFMCELHM